MANTTKKVEDNSSSINRRKNQRLNKTASYVKPDVPLKLKLKSTDDDAFILSTPGPTPEDIAKLSVSDYRDYLRTGEYVLTPKEVGQLNTSLNYSANTFLNGEGEFVVPADIVGLTSVVNIGTGTTLASTSGSTVSIKSVSVKGGLSLIGDRSNLIISGQTNVTPTWASVTAKPSWLSGTTLSNFQLNHTHSQYGLNSVLTGHTSNSTIHFKQSGITISQSQVTNLVTNLAAKSGTGHTHTQYSSTGHTHAQYATVVNLTGHTSDSTIHFKQSGITISESQVTNLTVDLAAKSGTGHTHAQYALATGVTTINNQTGITYTLAASDHKNLVLFGNVSGITVTVPANSGTTIPIGCQIDCVQTLAGKVTFAPENGAVTINSKGNLLSIGDVWVGVTLMKIGTDEWILFGDLIA